MSNPIRTANDTEGVPPEVVRLFDERRIDFATFALQGDFEVRPYENHDDEDGTWGWNFYGRAWGRKVCIQVSTDPEMARRGRFNLWVYVHRQEVFGPQDVDDFLEIRGWATDGAYLKKALERVADYLAGIVSGLPWKPTKPETV